MVHHYSIECISYHRWVKIIGCILNANFHRWTGSFFCERSEESFEVVRRILIGRKNLWWLEEDVMDISFWKILLTILYSFENFERFFQPLRVLSTIQNIILTIKDSSNRSQKKLQMFSRKNVLKQQKTSWKLNITKG